MSNTLCPPAAATSSARLACSCPRISSSAVKIVRPLSSPGVSSSLRLSAWAGESGLSPVRCRTSATTWSTGYTSKSGISAASRASQAGTNTLFNPRRRASAVIGSTPRTWRTEPSSESSPTIKVWSNAVAGNLAGSNQQPDGDRKIVGRAFLAQIGRRQVDGNAPVRKREAGVLHRGLNAFAAFLHGGIRQADNNKRRHAVGYVHFRLDHGAVETDHCTG